MNERKLNNYTVVYGVYECWECGNREADTGMSYCEKCSKRTDKSPVVALVHVKASSLHTARQAPEVLGRFIAAFEGHITGLLG